MQCNSSPYCLAVQSLNSCLFPRTHCGNGCGGGFGVGVVLVVVAGVGVWVLVVL